MLSILKTKNLKEKIKRKLRGEFLTKISGTPFQFLVYRTYWHSKLRRNKKIGTRTMNSSYIGQKPNYGAGIGHQLANWNSGFYFSKIFELRFAHFPFSTVEWESFLGFGENETKAAILLNKNSIKKRRLPRFNVENEKERVLIENILISYRNRSIFFMLEQDQAYASQCDTAKELSFKFFNASFRKKDKLFYSDVDFNIAIHIRRGDIVDMQNEEVSNWKKRWLTDEYYVNILSSILVILKQKRKIKIFLFSQGMEDDFNIFKQFDNLTFCLDTNPIDTFMHLACAELLITSKSSFSYKPALISKGIKICPANFWHKYPLTDDYILVDDSGMLDDKDLCNRLNKLSN